MRPVAFEVLEPGEDRVLLRLGDDALRDERVEHRLHLVGAIGRGRSRVRRAAVRRQDPRDQRGLVVGGRERGEGRSTQERAAEDPGRRDDGCLPADPEHLFVSFACSGPTDLYLHI